MTKKDVASTAAKGRGRPHELTDELIARAMEYLLGGYIEAGDVFPTVEGMACYIGKSRSRVYEYAKQSDEFKDIVESVLTVQGKKLINGGILGDYNPTITKLLLAKHGYAEKVEADYKSSDGSMTPSQVTADQFKDIAKEILGKV